APRCPPPQPDRANPASTQAEAIAVRSARNGRDPAALASRPNRAADQGYLLEMSDIFIRDHRMSTSTLPSSTVSALSPEETLRYARHLILPEVGASGQTRLKQARVLLVGAGGLGSPAGLYLAAAGVGTLGLVDFDVVDATNLQRQVIHGTADI